MRLRAPRHPGLSTISSALIQVHRQPHATSAAKLECRFATIRFHPLCEPPIGHRDGPLRLVVLPYSRSAADRDSCDIDLFANIHALQEKFLLLVQPDANAGTGYHLTPYLIFPRNNGRFSALSRHISLHPGNSERSCLTRLCRKGICCSSPK